MKNLTTYINESQINESDNPIKDKYPNVKELGIGEFDGALWGHCFLYEGKKYYSEINICFHKFFIHAFIIIDIFLKPWNSL